MRRPRRLQKLAPGGAGLGKGLERGMHGPGPAGDHGAPLRVAIHVGDAHQGPISAQLLGDDARQRGPHVLAHFSLSDKNMRSARAINLIPKAGGKGGVGAARGQRFHGALRGAARKC